MTGPVVRTEVQRRGRRLRPTLRLRLTLLNGVLLVGAGILLISMSFLLVSDALHPAEQLRDGTRVVLANGSELDAREWQELISREARNEIIAKGLLALLAISVVGVAGGYAVVGRALRPLQSVTATARQLSGQTLSRRINYAGADDEVAELADTFDEMLDRLALAFDSQRRFVANASHELRTPLAVMRTEIDVTLSDPTADVKELRRMGTVVSDASQRANALVDALLVLARSEAATALSRREPADLADGVPRAIQALGNEVKRLALGIDVDLEASRVVGDPSLLERLAGNLIENAVRYNHRGGRIWVRTASTADHATLVVGNTGFEVEQADVPGLFEPFRRGGRERTGARGAGLGLSIVRAVCDAHGGTVSAIALPGGGLEVTVALPLASAG
ncbi:signal transduction histidine kinase [Allocatelliglobosispora scoriae]|uniref:histidine kinase n=1 Tax=Allocatelliglobosispora scoriae TaxID=643052 RepID=A0A841BY68_9ACTN|nr:HAMP domain-containing sensor histidine kinase [Allocatelliglobosispora scoriae]MBB5872418.1 signal transduction histidine kinase [Allocatelliglobosispora scoriae]